MLQHQIKLILPFFIILGLVIGCAGEEDSSDTANENNSNPNIEMQTQNTPANDNALQDNNPMQVTDANGEVVYHYVCPNGCEGGGGPGQAPCPVCGTMFEHNTRYHQVQQANSNNTPVMNQTQNQNIEAQQPSAQNAAGEYHWICPEGCAGGAASQGVCSNCGASLTHNSAYHN